MKKYIAAVCAVMLMLSLPGGAFAVVYGKAGYELQGYSEATAWEIDSAAVLAKFRDDVNAGKLQYEFYVKLTKDIDLTERSYLAWEPIGYNPYAQSWSVNPNDERGVLRGHFDGKGHTIKVEISKLVQKPKNSGSDYFPPIYQGLFGIIMGGSIKNLNVSGNIAIMKRDEASPICVGGIAAYLGSGSIENCKFNGTITSSGQSKYSSQVHAGGIVGRAGYGAYIFSIKNCRVGSFSDTEITASGTSAIEEAEHTYAGGIAAYLDDNTYKNNSSTVSGNYVRAEINGRYSGGLCGTRGRGTGLVYDNIEDDPSEPPPDSTTLTITTATLPGGNIGENYSGTLTATMTGGTWPVTWSVASGTLPAGLKLDTSAGTISGSPTAKGTYSFTVKASIGSSGVITATKQYSVTITDNQASYALTVKNASLSSGTVGKSYTETLRAEYSGTELTASWSCTGSLPEGLTLDSSGTISGTPTKAGTYTFTVKAEFLIFTGSKTFTVTIASAAQTVIAPTITATSLTSGKIGTAYSATLTASGTTPITWTVSGLPGGLTHSNGKISGTPSESGTFSVKVTATNAAGNASKTLTLTVASGGGGTDTPEDEDDEVVPEFKAHQPVLEGQIIVNFFALLPEIYGVDYNNSYVKFKVLNDTTYNPVQEYNASFTKQGKSGTYYGFRCCLTSIQMADPITATLHYGNGKTIVHEYKLTDYLDKYYAASTTPEALRNIVGAMKDYGHYAQIALAEANGWELGTDHIATEAANVYTVSDIEETKQAVEKYAKSWSVGLSGIQSIAYRLVLDSDTALELMLRPASGYTGKVCAYSRGAIGITDTGANLAVKQSDGRYLVQISGIPAHRLDYTNTIRVVTDNGEFDVKVSALSYVNTILNSTKYNDNMKKAVTSLYRYYKATKEYRESAGM